jgi:hypothetical protein
LAQNRAIPAASESPELVAVSWSVACDWSGVPANHAPPPRLPVWPCASAAF